MTNYNPCGCTMGAPCSMVSQCTMDQVTEDMLADFSVEMKSMKERVERLEEWIVELNGFRAVAASCIKSGEPWTPVMQAAFERSENPLFDNEEKS